MPATVFRTRDQVVLGQNQTKTLFSIGSLARNQKAVYSLWGSFLLRFIGTQNHADVANGIKLEINGIDLTGRERTYTAPSNNLGSLPGGYYLTLKDSIANELVGVLNMYPVGELYGTASYLDQIQGEPNRTVFRMSHFAGVSAPNWIPPLRVAHVKFTNNCPKRLNLIWVFYIIKYPG